MVNQRGTKFQAYVAEGHVCVCVCNVCVDVGVCGCVCNVCVDVGVCGCVCGCVV